VHHRYSETGARRRPKIARGASATEAGVFDRGDQPLGQVHPPGLVALRRRAGNRSRVPSRSTSPTSSSRLRQGGAHPARARRTAVATSARAWRGSWSRAPRTAVVVPRAPASAASPADHGPGSGQRLRGRAAAGGRSSTGSASPVPCSGQRAVRGTSPHQQNYD
jgi:hypothetical protein